MKTSLHYLPEEKQAELKNIVKIIRAGTKVEMIILFGSYARGDFVDCDIRYDEEEGHTTSYESDFDILVITRTEETANNTDIWYKSESIISDHVSTPVSLVVEGIDHVNEQLSVGRYFYADIKKEGVLLYDSKKYQLARAKKLTNAIKKKLAEEDHKIWFPKAKRAFSHYEFDIQNRWNNEAAFNLHQTTEALLSAASLVLTSYKPKTHDLEKLMKRMEGIEPDFTVIFPRQEEKEKRLFELLRKAYVDARYKKSYKITKRELEYLAELVKKLRKLALKKCREKIKEYTISDSRNV